MTHRTLFLDFETYYDDEYSLRKLTPPEYILSPKFELIGCAVKEHGTPSRFIDGPDFKAWLSQYDPADTTTVTFNALFDNCILGWRYNFVPARMYCAMRMAAALWGHELRSVSLASVSKYCKLPPKGDEIIAAKGMHRIDLLRSPTDPAQWRAYQAYACRDNDNCEGIFNKAYPEFPAQERKIMDRVLRCAVQPSFWVDTKMLEQHLADLEAFKQKTLVAAGCTIKELRSNVKFEALLKAKGVDIEYKQSPTNPENKIPAFAKTDEFMANLQDHEDPEVQALAAARLGARSTIEQTRGQRIMDIAKLPWRGGPHLPIPLKYSAAHTHRLGGDWKINPQNLPSSRQVGSKLRKSLMAPPNHKVVVADASQIQCRVNAWICGQEDLLQTFRDKGDPYSRLGSYIFGIPVDKTTHGGFCRFVGKTGVLGLGFMCGKDKFYNMVLRTARAQGIDPVILKTWTPDLAAKAVRVYRETNHSIVSTWGTLRDILATAWLGMGGPVRFGPCLISRGCVEGPGGLKMRYGNPRIELDVDGKEEFRFDYGARSYKIYSGLFLENIVQFMERIIVMNAMLRVGDRTGAQLVLQSHDELVWIVPDQDAKEHLAVAIEEMSKPPSWAPDLPMAAEGNIGQSYGEAK
jgi:DNA polymerase